MRGKTLNFDGVEINRKAFHASKQQIGRNLEDVNKIGITSIIEDGEKNFSKFELVHGRLFQKLL